MMQHERRESLTAACVESEEGLTVLASGFSDGKSWLEPI